MSRRKYDDHPIRVSGVVFVKKFKLLLLLFFSFLTLHLATEINGVFLIKLTSRTASKKETRELTEKKAGFRRFKSRLIDRGMNA